VTCCGWCFSLIGATNLEWPLVVALAGDKTGKADVRGTNPIFPYTSGLAEADGSRLRLV